MTLEQQLLAFVFTSSGGKPNTFVETAAAVEALRAEEYDVKVARSNLIHGGLLHASLQELSLTNAGVSEARKLTL